MLTIINILQILIVTKFSHSVEWKFPPNFKFGVATASYQTEGGWNEDNKALSIWDSVTHNRSFLISDRSNGDIACDSYHQLDEDIKMIKNLGVDYYRFSLSWPRIIPDGTTTKINLAGVDYYNRLINKLLEIGVQPVVTIFHWDLPEKFTALGGWTNPIIIPYFANYARKVFDLFGDRVKLWITLNEPRLICQNFKGLVGDVTAEFPLGIAEYLCTHNVIKAHAEAYHIYHREFRSRQKGKISITLDFTWTKPENASNSEDRRASDQFIQFDFGIFANPIMGFDYPKVVINRIAQRSEIEGFPESRLPKFTLAEKLRIRGTYDFLGINHYITYYGKAAEEPKTKVPNIQVDAGGERYQHPDWKGCAASWIKLTPWGLRELLKWLKLTYNNPEIIITENGYANAGDEFNDEGRINYYKEFLNATLQAILEDGVNVTSYIAWSLMDNFEWTNGYTLKFGLYHVNFTDPNRKRTPRKSVEYFKNVTRTRTV